MILCQRKHQQRLSECLYALLLCHAGGRRCANDCTSLPPWNHPSCRGCNKYVTCHAGKLYERVCPHKLEWDNKKRMCNWPAHSTCYDMVSLVAFHRDPQSLLRFNSRKTETVRSCERSYWIHGLDNKIVIYMIQIVKMLSGIWTDVIRLCTLCIVVLLRLLLLRLEQPDLFNLRNRRL